jgi:hypothetical protein
MVLIAVLTINEIAKPFLGREWRAGAGALGPGKSKKDRVLTIPERAMRSIVFLPMAYGFSGNPYSVSR